MTRFPFALTRTRARAQQLQPALDLALAPVVVLAEGILGALERGRRLALGAIGPDRARILRVVMARERIEAAWFPGDPL